MIDRSGRPVANRCAASDEIEYALIHRPPLACRASLPRERIHNNYSDPSQSADGRKTVDAVDRPETVNDDSSQLPFTGIMGGERGWWYRMLGIDFLTLRN